MSIEIRNLNKAYGEQIVFRDYQVLFEEGEITCIVGASGGGKTTLIRILLGLEKMDSGVLTGLEGRSLAAVFQEDRLAPNLSVRMNLKLVCPQPLDDYILQQHCQRVGLGDLLDKPVTQLSGGMKRRLAIVRAILVQADVLVMDEPFKGLDEELKAAVIAYVKEESQGKTLLVVTHDQQVIQMLAPQKIVEI